MCDSRKELGMKHSHYFKSVAHLDHIDVYRVLDLFGVTDAALGHAAKKILCAGVRGAKDQAKDVQEAIDTLTRWQEMQAENHIRDAAEKVSQPVDFGGHVDISQLRWETGKESPLSAMTNKTNATNNRPFVDIPECKTRETKHDLWIDDKELPSSGIYCDQGYTDQDWRRAECHRFSTDYAAKESQSPIVSNITINGVPVDKLQFDIATEKDVRAIEALIHQAENADTRNSPVGGALVHDAEAVIGDWIEYDGKGQPVGGDVLVFIGGFDWSSVMPKRAENVGWNNLSRPKFREIIHYRVKE